MNEKSEDLLRVNAGNRKLPLGLNENKNKHLA